MGTERLTLTAAQLAALAPRELNRLAAAILPAVDIDWRDDDDLLVSDDDAQLVPAKMPYVFADLGMVTFNSVFDLNHAALLEAELARRGLEERRAARLAELVVGNVLDWTWRGEVSPSIDYTALANNQRASAKSRTIAAILAAQG